MDKETRLNYGESLMTHAMVFTAFDKDESNALPVSGSQARPCHI
jgi:aminopeptidase C